jgi:hypothetical protein
VQFYVTNLIVKIITKLAQVLVEKNLSNDLATVREIVTKVNLILEIATLPGLTLQDLLVKVKISIYINLRPHTSR